MGIETGDNNQESLQESENPETEESLLDLKKQIAEDVANKILEKNPDVVSVLAKDFLADYLVDEKTLTDVANDYTLAVIGTQLDIVTPVLKRYREMINGATTKNDLEVLKNTIFNEIDGGSQDQSQVQENQNGSQEIQENEPQQFSQQNQRVDNFSGSNSGGSNGKAEADQSSKSYEIDHLNIIASEETKNLYNTLKGKEKPDLEPFACALKMYNNIKKQGIIENTKYMTVVDFTKKRGKHRFFVINMETYTVEHAVTVGHGKKSGGDRATEFSNEIGSNQSSLGGYLLPPTITKSPNKPWSGLRQIKGLEDSNSNSSGRGIAVHPGGEGGSEGCFTLPQDVSRNIMEKIAGTFLFAYAKDRDYFVKSDYFNPSSNGTVLAA